jgi:hypothetical protein
MAASAFCFGRECPLPGRSLGGLAAADQMVAPLPVYGRGRIALAVKRDGRAMTMPVDIVDIYQPSRR